MTYTSQLTLREWILSALHARGGSASKRQVIEDIFVAHGHELHPEELQPQRSRKTELVWQNNAAWQRQHMVNDGLLLPVVERGIWTLSELGNDAAWILVKAVDNVGPNSLTETQIDPSEFKPKDDSEYLAFVRGSLQVRTREHETLIKDYGHFLLSSGMFPRTNCHPIDFQVLGSSERIIGEAKVLYSGNATDAVRAAMAQLFMYRHFITGHKGVQLLALFSESVGDAYVNFLDGIGILAVWRNDQGWHGSERAKELKLA